MNHVVRVAAELVAITSVVGAAFTAFFALDARYAHERALEAHRQRTEALRLEVTEDAIRAVKLSESTRYAEVAAFYAHKMEIGEELDEAQKARLDLSQRQQIRITDEVKELDHDG